MGRVSIRSWFVALLPLAGCLGVCLWIHSYHTGKGDVAESGPASENARQKVYMPMKFEFPAVENPPLDHADEVSIDDDAIVIGVVVNGETRAYLREAFEDHPDRHIVTDSIDETPIAVTHCDRIRCTRVFTGPKLEDAKNIHVGGWRFDQTLALIVDDKECSQKSPEIPLADVPFLELPWGMWRELFPDTLVYVGAGAG